MKKQRASARSVTNDDLRQALKDVVRKDDLEIKLTNFSRELDHNLDERFAKQKEDIANEFAEQLKDLLLPYMELIDDHDKRMEHLEIHTTHPPIPL